MPSLCINSKYAAKQTVTGRLFIATQCISLALARYRPSGLSIPSVYNKYTVLRVSV